MGTVIIAGILLAAVAAIAASMRRDRKQGKSACGGDCAHCKGCHH